MKKKIIIVISNYYKEISNNLLKSSLGELNKFFVVKIVKVPGVFEIPITIVKNINKADGFIALGCVIKGQTPHFNFISSSTIEAIMQITIKYKKPIGNGIITCLNKKQAVERSRKGSEASKAVISILLQWQVMLVLS